VLLSIVGLNKEADRDRWCRSKYDLGGNGRWCRVELSVSTLGRGVPRRGEKCDW